MVEKEDFLSENAQERLLEHLDNYLKAVSQRLMGNDMNPAVLRDQMAILDELIDAGRRGNIYASLYRNRHIYNERVGIKEE